MTQNRDYHLDRIEVAMSEELPEELRTALSKLSYDNLRKLATYVEQGRHHLLAHAHNTARCPKDRAHGPHQFHGKEGQRECLYCKVQEK